MQGWMHKVIYFLSKCKNNFVYRLRGESTGRSHWWSHWADTWQIRSAILWFL